jgi:hypothetical protein
MTLDGSDDRNLVDFGAHRVFFEALCAANPSYLSSSLTGRARLNYLGDSPIALPDTCFFQLNLANGTADVGAYLNENFATTASSFADAVLSRVFRRQSGYQRP